MSRSDDYLPTPPEPREPLSEDQIRRLEAIFADPERRADYELGMLSATVTANPDNKLAVTELHKAEGEVDRVQADRDEILGVGRDRAAHLRAAKGLSGQTRPANRSATAMDAWRLIAVNPRLGRVADFIDSEDTYAERPTPLNGERLDRAAKAVVRSEENRNQSAAPPAAAAKRHTSGPAPKPVPVVSRGVNGVFTPTAAPGRTGR